MCFICCISVWIMGGIIRYKRKASQWRFDNSAVLSFEWISKLKVEVAFTHLDVNIGNWWQYNTLEKKVN